MVNSDAGKLILFLLNRLQSTERSASLSSHFVSVQFSVSVFSSLSSLFLDTLITSSILPAWFIYPFCSNNKMESRVKGSHPYFLLD